MNEHDPYMIYMRTYGKIASGTKLTNADYGLATMDGFQAYGPEGHAAISLAAQDVKLGCGMREKSAIDEDVQRLLGTK